MQDQVLHGFPVQFFRFFGALTLYLGNLFDTQMRREPESFLRGNSGSFSNSRSGVQAGRHIPHRAWPASSWLGL
jgi:hypothetical protein